MVKPTLATMLHPTRAALLRESRQTPGGGVVTSISWNRLADILKSSGDVTAWEDVTAFVIEDSGLTICLNLRERTYAPGR